ncbi:MAG: hypothetical protein KDD25_10365, partial [Bdellovibrionales bacterium]|nr:hypothetical protein [Bdellovibrionales bacterium]
MRQYQLLILVLLAVILGAYQNCGKMPSSQIGTNEFGDIGGDFSDGIGLEPVGIAPGGDGTDNPGDSDGSGLVFQANCVYDRNTPIMFFLLFYDAKTKLTRWD